jgi:hypothetical protein
MAGTWVNGAPADVLGGETLGTTYWEDGAPATLLVAQGVTTLTVDVFDAATVVESLTHTLPTLQQLPVSVSESVGVSEATAYYTTPTLITVAETVSVVDVPGYATAPPMEIGVFDTLTVAENLRRSGPITVRVSDAIPVRESLFRKVRIPEKLTRTELLTVREFVKAQLNIGGGLWVRVHETITVTHNHFYMGYQSQVGTPSTATLGGGPDGTVTVTAATTGSSPLTVTVVTASSPNQPLSVAQVGNVITVTLATDATGAADPTQNTAAQVAAAINAALNTVSASASGAGSTPVPPSGGAVPLTGGTTVGSTSQPNYNVLGAGPNPAIPAAGPGTDYWIDGV